ncbi:MAG TPA: hypothetical protein VKC54_00375 [Patescibacteria group bacterium]|nr:hypothetical protein [Patescibacteria group bacterium]
MNNIEKANAKMQRVFCMKIKEYYLNKASYIAIDENGKRIDIDIDYWKNNFRISKKNVNLETFAKRLLKKKHKVNFVHKMLE